MDWHVGNGHAPQDLSAVDVDRFLEHVSNFGVGHRRPIRIPTLAFSITEKGLTT